MKHQPGPWTVCGNGKCSCKTVSAPDYPIATVTVGPWGDDYPALRLTGSSSLDQKAEAYMEQITYGEVSEELARANALLIAAAPDMLAALQAVMAEWRDGYGLNCVDQVRAALAKAENGDSGYEERMASIRDKIYCAPTETL